MRRSIAPGRGSRFRLLWAPLLSGVLFLNGCGAGDEVKDEAAPEVVLAAEIDALVVKVEAPRDTGQEGFEPGYGDRAAEDARLTMDELLESTGTPGLSVAVFRDSEVLWARGWGTRDRETGEAVEPETLFQAASISKPIASMAVLEAVERGWFELDQPINEILTRFELPADRESWLADVTPRRLMSHTAGTTVHGFPGYSPRDTVPDAVGVLLGKGNTDPVRVDIEPGSESRYSGGGSTVMQVALEDAVGMSFPDILRQWVLDPAGASASGYHQELPPKLQAGAARAHVRPEDPTAASERSEDPWHLYPELYAAGLWTTPSELCLLAIDVQRAIAGDEDRVLRPETAREMTTQVDVGSYGLGFNTVDRGSAEQGIWYFSHTGGNWGFRSYLMARRDGGYGAAIMVNGADFDIILEVMKRIALSHEWEGDLLAPPRNWQ